jgi:hypothetical protein
MAEMADWEIAQTHPLEQLARLHLFSMTKRQPDGDVEFQITVREYATAQQNLMRFFATADKETNQNTAAYTPTGWGNSLEKALTECLRAIHLFPYEGPRSAENPPRPTP